jgi:hypothetical protein
MNDRGQGLRQQMRQQKRLFFLMPLIIIAFFTHFSPPPRRLCAPSLHGWRHRAGRLYLILIPGAVKRFFINLRMRRQNVLNAVG